LRQGRGILLPGPTHRHDSDPYTPEFFKNALGTSYASAQRIVPLVLAIVPARSVLDVGCGTGHFLRAFREAGVSEITGIDGDHVPRDQLVIEAHHFVPADQIYTAAHVSALLDMWQRAERSAGELSLQ